MIIIGCLLVGIGIGQLTGNLGPGALIGLGIGFVAESFLLKRSPFGRSRPSGE